MTLQKKQGRETEIRRRWDLWKQDSVDGGESKIMK